MSDSENADPAKTAGPRNGPRRSGKGRPWAKREGGDRPWRGKSGGSEHAEGRSGGRPGGGKGGKPWHKPRDSRGPEPRAGGGDGRRDERAARSPRSASGPGERDFKPRGKPWGKPAPRDGQRDERGPPGKPWQARRDRDDRKSGPRDGQREERAPHGKPWQARRDQVDRKPGRRPWQDKARSDDRRPDRPSHDRDRGRPHEAGGEGQRRADEDLVRIAGLPAVSQLFKAAPERVERLFFAEERAGAVKEMCQSLAARRKVYRQLPEDELRKVAGSVMHGGVVAMARPKPVADLDLDAARQWAAAGEHLLILDGVGNPQNIGALARTAAFFGLKRLVLSDHGGQGSLSSAAYRVAEGGLEHLDVFRAHDLPAVLLALRPVYNVVGTALDQGRPLAGLMVSSRKPVALVLGNEEAGLPPATLAACPSVVRLDGPGLVQSLNVSAAGAILIHALLRNPVRQVEA